MGALLGDRFGAAWASGAGCLRQAVERIPMRCALAAHLTRIFVYGNEESIRSVDHARSLGIDTVYQDLALVPSLSVTNNMFLNRELTLGVGPFRWLHNREMRRRAREHIGASGIRTLRSVDAEVAMLSGGQRQAIAIARSVHSGARTLLFDEPLAAMGAKEGEEPGARSRWTAPGLCRDALGDRRDDDRDDRRFERPTRAAS